MNKIDKINVFGMLAALAALSMTASGCNGSNDPALDRQPSHDGPMLEGVWRSECLPNAQQSIARSWEFRGDQFSSVVLFFTDAQCRDYGYQGEGLKGTFRLAGVSRSVAGAWQIDLHGADPVGAQIDLFDVVSVQGDTLQLGNFPGQSDAERASELNPYLVFKKVR